MSSTRSGVWTQSIVRRCAVEFPYIDPHGNGRHFESHDFEKSANCVTHFRANKRFSRKQLLG